MNLYAITIEPTAGFGTALKADTIFGHFCWQAAHDPELLNGGLDKWIAEYPRRPFAVFSSAYVVLMENGRRLFALKRPDLPFNFFHLDEIDQVGDEFDQAKEIKKRKWLLVGEEWNIDFRKPRLITEKELYEKLCGSLKEEVLRLAENKGEPNWFVKENRSHNTINRLSLTTGAAPFAPYTLEVGTYLPETELAVWVLIDEEATDRDRVLKGIERIGRFGFGRDASTGLGRFEVKSCDLMKPADPNGSGAFYTLGPCLPEPGAYRHSHFTPFVRFGRHGDQLAVSANPFKRPVLMADEGAVFVPKETPVVERAYIGRAVSGVSLVQENAVTQGYTIVIPIQLGVNYES